MYEIQLPEFAKDGNWTVIRKNDYTLYLSSSSSEAAPGITLVAQVDDLNPTWNWEEFQDWSLETRTAVFGDFYDSKYPSLRVSYQGTCSIQVDSFEHPDSAQEVAYGQWLHNLPQDKPISRHAKGLLVTVSIDQCKTSLGQLRSKAQLLKVTVTGVSGVGAASIDIEFRIGDIGT